eukprot:1592411-Amphidinium_carterae.1
MGTPGSKTIGTPKGQQQPLDAEGKAFMHFAAGPLQHVLDALMAVNSEANVPTETTRMKAKRIVRYLVSHRTLEWALPLFFRIETDSDWGGHNSPDPEAARKSTSSTMAYFGQHLLEAGCSLQHRLAWLSGEAELYFLNKGGVTALMMKEFLEAVEIHLTPELATDSNAERGIATRLGVGRVCHIAMRD